MSADRYKLRCKQAEDIPLFAVDALPADEMRDVEAHVASCAECHQELASFREVTRSFVSWPTDLLRPDPSLWRLVAERILAETGMPQELPGSAARLEPEWEDAGPGIACKLLTTDTARGRVSMLVRLAPGVDYPPHIHAEFEELHLLEGELWIDDRKLHPGDFSRGERGTGDRRVWSETGCTCFLTTSFRDVLG